MATKKIEFLPDIYRERAALRRARIWWLFVVLVFSAAIGSTAGAQFYLRRSVQRQLDALEPVFFAAKKQVEHLTLLQTQTRTAGQWAGLCTYLESRWPRTQLLAAVADPLPPELCLTEIKVFDEDLPRPATEEGAAPRRSGRGNDPTEPKLPPAVSDLEQLRDENDYRQTVIEISGHTNDPERLHGYVEAVGKSPIIARATIKSLEASPAESKTKQTKFTLRVLVRPCHGLPGSEHAARQSLSEQNLSARPNSGGPGA